MVSRVTALIFHLYARALAVKWTGIVICFRCVFLRSPIKFDDLLFLLKFITRIRLAAHCARTRHRVPVYENMWGGESSSDCKQFIQWRNLHVCGLDPPNSAIILFYLVLLCDWLRGAVWRNMCLCQTQTINNKSENHPPKLLSAVFHSPPNICPIAFGDFFIHRFRRLLRREFK